MPPSILIVDDDAPIRSVLRRKLEQYQYDVCEAADGNEAIRALETTRFDLVITDIIMPEKDGIETICFLRLKQPEVKIIAISAPRTNCSSRAREDWAPSAFSPSP